MSRKKAAAQRRRQKLEVELAEQTPPVTTQAEEAQAPAHQRTLILQALLSAALLALAAPPMDLWPLALVALVPLLLGLRNATPMQALAPAWLCGFAINLIGFRWGYMLLDRFGHLPAWARVLALLLLAAYQASVFSLWAGLGTFLTRSARVPWLVSLPLAVAVAESVLPFLFPWNLAVTVWRAWPLLQVAEFGGAPAVSALVVLINLTLLEAGLALRHGHPLPRPVRVACGVVLAVVTAGLLRAMHVAAAREAAPKVRVGIVQPNSGTVTAEDRKHRGEQYLATLRQATHELARGGAELVVWPESAFPYLFDRQLTREYAPGHPWELRPGFSGTLLFGALSHTFGGALVHNSAVLASPDGRITGLSDKRRLFPFGEYVPFADRFPAWAQRVRARLPDSPDIEPGTEPRLLVSGSLRIAPLVCYEDILPSAVYPLVRQGPNLLVTLANHAWFGDGDAPYQALALATLRSVETRRDLVRAASTGVSSVGDALGRVQGHTSLTLEPGAPEVLAGEVALVELFAFGPFLAPAFPFLCALALVVLALLGRGARSSAS
ncbi:apolipoprotein N-acyltransferase [Archangium lansingense]|uniref:Apolipoprotein N-acyltransferase n=1 Tax=Archangium lansingense TaxID=2995310 RepID=A0ABT4AFN3_9BACT|nr:apolipoprotein N-acyltransferase [Archangium lansinium]MCY1080488.1 apolipoprotein N-acyltransferase [Archangium lansinium]